MLTVLGNAQLRSGNLHGALATLDEADHHVRRIGDLATEAVLTTLRAEALFWRNSPDDLEEATATAERARAVVGNTLTSWAVAVRCTNAEFILHTGDPARAGWLLLDTAGGAELPRFTAWRRPRWCESLAQVAAAEGDQVSADRWARLAEESVEQLPSAGRRGFALRARMRAHALHGDTDSALRCAQDAIADFAASGDRIEAGRTLLTAAALALDAGRTDAVGGWLDRAAVLADQCGSARMAAEAADQRLRLASKDGAARASGLLSALTTQERRVAGLVSTGMTNSEIAETLVLSVRTVESHLAQAYRKLGVSNRTSLARAMLDRSPP
jgi:DNA-binding CsgD family transcriptional regulator